MSHTEDRDTLPPEPDEPPQWAAKLLVGFEELKESVNDLDKIVRAAVNEINRQAAKERVQDEEIGYVKHQIRTMTPAAGIPAVRANGNGADG